MRIAIVSDSHLAPEASALNDIIVDGAGDPTQYQWVRHFCADWPTELCFLPGNHDIGDNPPAPGAAIDQPVTAERLARYRAAFGADYWALDIDDWRLIGPNAQLMGSALPAEEEPWHWLFDRAGEAGERPVVLMLHKPLCRTTWPTGNPGISYLPFVPRQRLRQAMAIMDVKAALSAIAISISTIW